MSFAKTISHIQEFNNYNSVIIIIITLRRLLFFFSGIGIVKKTFLATIKAFSNHRLLRYYTSNVLLNKVVIIVNILND